jgi:hypothetical protein
LGLDEQEIRRYLNRNLKKKLIWKLN